MSGDSLEARFAARMGALFGPGIPPTLGLAVSGGGDSMAMLALTHAWARIMGVSLRVVTIDHGLRPEAAAETAMVAEECRALGHPHDTLHWQWDGTGNLQAAAREARRALIGDWRGDTSHVLFAHTQDDQAETVLMRLLRGSGVEGLAGMRARHHVPDDRGGWWLVRPLLEETRADLRHYADTLRLPYVDDPSNDDPRYDRVRMRNAMTAFGLDASGLARTAARMARATDAVQARAAEVAARIVTPEVVNTVATGDLLIDRDGLAMVERDTQMRLVADALCRVSSSAYRPRAQPLEDLLDRVLGGAGGTLHGVEVTVSATRIRLAREFAAVASLQAAARPGARWDGRWRVGKAVGPGLTIRALGPAGWAQRPENKALNVPVRAAWSWPALFEGDRLAACMPMGVGPDGAIRPCDGHPPIPTGP